MKKKTYLMGLAVCTLLLSACSTPGSSSTPSSAPSSEHSSSEPSSSSTHNHNYGEWMHDENEHWKECIECHEKEYVGAHEYDEEILKEATCLEDGEKQFTCEICQRTYTEPITKLEHDYSEKVSLVEPTHDQEGSVTYRCVNGCEETKVYKILKLPVLSLVGSTFVWTEVENATGYKFYKDDEEIDVGGLTSFELSSTDLDVKTFAVRAYTTNVEYVEYNELKEEVALYKKGENIQAQYNYDFEGTTGIKLNRTAAWNLYPYGNWSDLDSNNVGGHYYIETQEDGNTCLKVPAVVWYPGNTTVKKDLSRETALPGTYEISFDIKASNASLVNTANGKYGAIAMYMWNDCDGRVGTSTVTKDGSWVVKDIANEETWSNVRVRYSITTAGTYNQFNLIYWPEGSVSEANCIYLDNIKVYKVVDGTVIEENIDTLEGGDLEKWSQNPMTENMWYANDTVLIENSARGSSFIKEGDNRALKVQSASNEAAINLKGNVEQLSKGGIFEMSLKVKKGSDLEDPAFGFTMWSFKNGSPFQLVDPLPISIADAKTDEYTTYNVRFFSKGHDGAESLNIYFWVGLNNASNDSENKYIIMDDVCIYKLDTTQDDGFNMLAIGNSHSDDTIDHVYRILESLNYEEKFNLYFLYIGGSTIDDHYYNFSNNLGAYELRTWDYENKRWDIMVGVSIKNTIAIHLEWDIVQLQQSTRTIITAPNAGFEHLGDLITGILDLTGNKTEIAFLGTWTYTDGVLDSSFGTLDEQYQKIVDIWKNNFGEDNEYGVKYLLPNATMVENLRTKYGEAIIFRDDIHLSFGFGRLAAGLAFVEFYLTDITGCTYLPTGVSQTQLLDAINAAKAAVENPFEVTTL